MERLFGGKVFLEIWVKVRRGWADDGAALAAAGLRACVSAEPRAPASAPAYVLHAYPYSETSLIVEAFTRDARARCRCSRKGARRPGSALRGVLLAFQPLASAGRAAASCDTLVRCEWYGALRRCWRRARSCAAST